MIDLQQRIAEIIWEHRRQIGERRCRCGADLPQGEVDLPEHVAEQIVQQLGLREEQP